MKTILTILLLTLATPSFADSCSISNYEVDVKTRIGKMSQNQVKGYEEHFFNRTAQITIDRCQRNSFILEELSFENVSLNLNFDFFARLDNAFLDITPHACLRDSLNSQNDDCSLVFLKNISQLETLPEFCLAGQVKVGDTIFFHDSCFSNIRRIK